MTTVDVVAWTMNHPGIGARWYIVVDHYLVSHDVAWTYVADRDDPGMCTTHAYRDHDTACKAAMNETAYDEQIGYTLGQPPMTATFDAGLVDVLLTDEEAWSAGDPKPLTSTIRHIIGVFAEEGAVI